MERRVLVTGILMPIIFVGAGLILLWQMGRPDLVILVGVFIAVMFLGMEASLRTLIHRREIVIDTEGVVERGKPWRSKTIPWTRARRVTVSLHVPRAPTLAFFAFADRWSSIDLAVDRRAHPDLPNLIASAVAKYGNEVERRGDVASLDWSGASFSPRDVRVEDPRLSPSWNEVMTTPFIGLGALLGGVLVTPQQPFDEPIRLAILAALASLATANYFFGRRAVAFALDSDCWQESSVKRIVAVLQATFLGILFSILVAATLGLI